MTAEVLIVHCIDAEGPLHESLGARFARLRELFGIEHLDSTRDTLQKLRRQEIDLDGNEEAVAKILGDHLGTYNETWDDVDRMLEFVRGPDFRNVLLDAHGQGWKYNWHCLDHVGYDYNPRRRDMGHHSVFDHYREILGGMGGQGDGLHWHYHPLSTYRDAHRCATSYFREAHLYEILTRKVIERGWFPTVFRAGFQAERPDSHWFLEQYIPFDMTNMSTTDTSDLETTIDFRNGRSADWRRAPNDWSVYQPSHDDYQVAGKCRRWIGRALNVLNRIASIDQEEMDRAFARAAGGQVALVGLASHDFRDIAPEVDHVRSLIQAASAKYPEVAFRYCEAVEAFRIATGSNDTKTKPLRLDVVFHPLTETDVPWIEIIARTGSVFGPQPFLAIETVSRRFIHDNLDFDLDAGRWFYAFHGDTLPWEDVVRIGVAANDAAGNSSVRVFDRAELDQAAAAEELG